jgi:hypothetical protein
LDALDRRGLASTVRADQSHHLASADVEIEIVDDGTSPIGLTQAADGDDVILVRCECHTTIIRRQHSQHINPRVEPHLHPGSVSARTAFPDRVARTTNRRGTTRS